MINSMMFIFHDQTVPEEVAGWREPKEHPSLPCQLGLKELLERHLWDCFCSTPTMPWQLLQPFCCVATCVCVCYADCEMEGPMPGAVYLLVVLSRGIPSINQPTSASSMDRIGDVP